MKRTLITLGLITALVVQAKDEAPHRPKPQGAIEVIGAVFTLAVGYVMIRGIIKLCNNINTNQSPLLTNDCAGLPTLIIETPSLLYTAVQSSRDLGSSWTNECEIYLTYQFDGEMDAEVWSKGVLMLRTNGPIVNGWGALDLTHPRPAAGSTLAAVPSAFFRLRQ